MLEKIALFAGLSATELRALESLAQIKRYRKQTVIIEKGDETSALYVLLEGKAQVYLADDEGKEAVLNVLDEPGTHFGELALLGETTRTASVMTLEDSKVLVISRAAFMACLAENPQIALTIIRGLVDQVKTLTERVGSLALKGVYERIVETLQNLAKEDGGRRITPALTQHEVAQRVGASREMVSRIFKELRVGGYIGFEGKRILLLKRLPARW